MGRPCPADVDRRFAGAFAEVVVSPSAGRIGSPGSKNSGHPTMLAASVDDLQHWGWWFEGR